MSLTVSQPAAPPPARGTLEKRTTALEARYGLLDARDLVADLIASEFGRRIALVSSFGTGSAVLLHMLAQADPAAPVLFVDTGKHFGETRRYRDELVARLGLADVRVIEPDPAAVDADDPQGTLWSREPDRCCFVRKVAPLERALAGFDAWFTGRRREHGAARGDLPRFEASDSQIKVNPLIHWSASDVDAYFAEHDLPRHPLEADGFRSIGCMTCTDRVAAGEDVRAGRWRGSTKIECGIHLSDHPFKDIGANI